MLAYIERIAVFIIVEGIILRLTTNDDYKKMIKICSGMILIIIVLSPLDEIFEFTGLVTEFLQEITGENKMEELKEVFSKSDEKNIEQVRKEYERVLSEGLKNIADKYGYIIKDVNVSFDETRQNYIGSISVYLTGKADGTEGDKIEENQEKKIEAIEKIETVRVRAESQQDLYDDNKNNIELPDIIAIKNSIVDEYGIDYERINIYTA
ncbi:MAG: stage III sporulation protein AF [Lachnospiraceae bacterium]